MKNLSRRQFLGASSSAFAFQFLPSRVWGANERINVAGIGVGGKGTADVASAAKLEFLLEGEIKTLSQAAMVFSLMNRDIDTTVPGVKNQSEAEEIAGCGDLGPIPASHMARLQELYQKGFSD